MQACLDKEKKSSSNKKEKMKAQTERSLYQNNVFKLECEWKGKKNYMRSFFFVSTKKCCYGFLDLAYNIYLYLC